MFLFLFKYMAEFKQMRRLKQQGLSIKKRGGGNGTKKKKTRLNGRDEKRPSDLDSNASVFRIRRILENGTSSYARAGPKSIDAGNMSSMLSNNVYSLNSDAEEVNDIDVVRRLSTNDQNDNET